MGDLSTREGKKAHLEEQWKLVAEDKEKRRFLAVAWMKGLDPEEFQNLLHFVRSPEDFEEAVFDGPIQNRPTYDEAKAMSYEDLNEAVGEARGYYRQMLYGIMARRFPDEQDDEELMK